VVVIRSKIRALRSVVERKQQYADTRCHGGALQQMKNGVFWDVTPCGSCKNRRFGGT
jgi:hypothetical protein